MEISNIESIKNRILSITDKSKMNEEQTKMSLILPLIQELGYDIFNIEELVPEYTADVGIKQGEKVDYAICMNGQPVILIETKRLGHVLNKDNISQLFRYYSSTDAKIGILTNGDDYWFFTDSNKKNTMDCEPYLKIKISESNNQILKGFEMYTKENIKDFNVVKSVQLHKYERAVRQFIGELYNGNINPQFIEWFASYVGIENIENTELASIFDGILVDKMKIKRDKIVYKDKISTVKKRTWDRSQKIELEIGKWYNFNTVDYSFHKPSAFKLDNLEIEVNHFSDILVQLISILVVDIDGEEKLLNESKYPLSVINKPCNEYRQIPNTSLYVNTKLSGNSIKKCMERVLTMFNENLSSLKIKFSE